MERRNFLMHYRCVCCLFSSVMIFIKLTLFLFISTYIAADIDNSPQNTNLTDSNNAFILYTDVKPTNRCVYSSEKN